MSPITINVMLSTETPVHIGTGDFWEPDADFVVELRGDRRYVRVIDAESALDSFDPADIGGIRDGMIARALGETGRQEHTHAYLRVNGQGNVGRVQRLMRLADGTPYIPGTTIKGAIRSALLRRLASDEDVNRAPQRGNPALFARILEQAVFDLPLDTRGRRSVSSPNRDLNRLISVSDFVPMGEHGAVPAVYSMSAHRTDGADRGRGIPIWCEAIPPGFIFEGRIAVQNAGPLWQAAGDEHRSLLRSLIQTAADDARELANLEREAWRSAGRGLDTVRSFFDRVAEEDSTFLPIGWGTGWLAKTVGRRMRPETVEAVADAGRLNRWRGRDFPHRFPITRKLAAAPGGPLPPGWVSVLSY